MPDFFRSAAIVLSVMTIPCNGGPSFTDAAISSQTRGNFFRQKRKRRPLSTENELTGGA